MRAGETDRLRRYLNTRASIDAAIKAGRVQRTKVAEAWLYHPADVTAGSLLQAAEDSANDLLDEWLLVRLPLMAGMLSRALEPPSSKRAVQLLLHALLRSGRLLGIGLLTARSEPYVATFRVQDRGEIEAQLVFARNELRRGCSLSKDDLPSPARHVPRAAWSELILGHAEFRCWGRLSADGIIEPWRQVQ